MEAPRRPPARGGNAPQQEPSNQNMRAGNPSGGQSSTGQSGNSPQQQPANQNAKSRTQDNQSGSQPSTTGQDGARSRRRRRSDERRDTADAAADPQDSPQGRCR